MVALQVSLDPAIPNVLGLVFRIYCSPAASAGCEVLGCSAYGVFCVQGSLSPAYAEIISGLACRNSVVPIFCQLSQPRVVSVWPGNPAANMAKNSCKWDCDSLIPGRDSASRRESRLQVRPGPTPDSDRPCQSVQVASVYIVVTC